MHPETKVTLVVIGFFSFSLYRRQVSPLIMDSRVFLGAEANTSFTPKNLRKEEGKAYEKKKTMLWCCWGGAVLGVRAQAHDVPDLSRKGSVTVTVRMGETPVAGGSLTLYRVGDIAEDDGNYSFALTEAFAASGASLTIFPRRSWRKRWQNMPGIRPG